MQAVGQTWSNFFFPPFLPHHPITEFPFLLQPLGVSVPAYSKSSNVATLCPCPKICPGGSSEQAAALCQGQTGAGCCFPGRATVEWHSSSWGNQKKIPVCLGYPVGIWKAQHVWFDKVLAKLWPRSTIWGEFVEIFGWDSPVCWHHKQRYPSAMPCCGSKFCLYCQISSLEIILKSKKL